MHKCIHWWRVGKACREFHHTIPRAFPRSNLAKSVNMPACHGDLCPIIIYGSVGVSSICYIKDPSPVKYWQNEPVKVDNTVTSFYSSSKFVAKYKDKHQYSILIHCV